MKFLIDIQHAKSSGIYIIRNSIDKRVYVGSAANFKKRYSSHSSLLNNRKHQSPYLQAFASKYGVDCLSFELLALCSKKDLLTTEQYHIDALQAFDRKLGFNATPVAGSRLGAKLSKETKDKIGAAHRGKKVSADVVEKIRQQQIGSKRTEETKAKISAAQKGRIFSAETRAKMSVAGRKKVLTPEHKANISAHFARLKADGIPIPGAFVKGRQNTPEHNAKLSEVTKVRWLERREVLENLDTPARLAA